MTLLRGALGLLASAFLIPLPAQAAGAGATQCVEAPRGIDVDAGPDVRIHVRTVGKGRPILFIPSLARGVADFDEVATRLSKEGYMAILPDPRGTGQTQAPEPKSLFDLAGDARAVAQRLCKGPVDIVGHAFGNRVARSFATLSPESVRSVVLLAGGGKAKPLPQVGDSIAISAAEGKLPDARRLAALQTAFFARGHDPAVWLTGWFSQAEAYQGVAMKGTTVDQWWAGGAAPILLVQADEDPIAPAGNVDELRKDIGDRMRTVTLRHASHAILPEQPAAVTELLSSYFAGQRDEGILQQSADARIRP